MARDQNGNTITRRVRKVRGADGQEGFAATCWFGTYPATNIRRSIYRTKAGAQRADGRDADTAREAQRKRRAKIIQNT